MLRNHFCAHGRLLEHRGIGEFFYVCGMKDGASHAWLEVDGLIVDITGDQFPDRLGIYVENQTLGTGSGRRASAILVDPMLLKNVVLDGRRLTLAGRARLIAKFQYAPKDIIFY